MGKETATMDRCLCEPLVIWCHGWNFPASRLMTSVTAAIMFEHERRMAVLAQAIVRRMFHSGSSVVNAGARLTCGSISSLLQYL